MGARIEIIYNPNTIIPPLDRVYLGESMLLQTGDAEFVALISNEFIGQEIAGFITNIESLISNPLVDDHIRDLGQRFVDALYLSFHRTEFRHTSERLTAGRIKHEYRHLEQSLAIFKDNYGGYADLLKLHRLHRAYRLGDRNSALSGEVIDFLDYSGEYLRTMMECDAMLAEFQAESKDTLVVNRECMLWRLSSTMKYLGRTDDLICDGFPHLKAMIVLLTGRLDLADKNEFSQINYSEFVPTMLENMKLGLENPQGFLNQIMAYESRIWAQLGHAFNLYLIAHHQFMSEALNKNVVPDWHSTFKKPGINSDP